LTAGGETRAVRPARPVALSRPIPPGLKELVAEASQALARVDGARLEELAAACRALSRDLGRDPVPASIEQRERLAREALEASGEMAIFARVLEATRANLKVMHRLRELRLKPIVYSERQARGGTVIDGGECRPLQNEPVAYGPGEFEYGHD
jgi:hypothetical protein